MLGWQPRSWVKRTEEFEVRKSWVQVCNILSLKCTEHFNFEYGYQCCLFEIQEYMSRISAQPLVINMIQLWRKLVSGLLSLQDAKILSQIVQHQIHHITCCNADILCSCFAVYANTYSMSLVIWYYTLAQNNSNVSTDNLWIAMVSKAY